MRDANTDTPSDETAIIGGVAGFLEMHPASPIGARCDSRSLYCHRISVLWLCSANNSYTRTRVARRRELLSIIALKCISPPIAGP
jgi:hypothetical protein